VAKCACWGTKEEEEEREEEEAGYARSGDGVERVTPQQDELDELDVEREE